MTRMHYGDLIYVPYLPMWFKKFVPLRGMEGRLSLISPIHAEKNENIWTSQSTYINNFLKP
jgi:hypothetical protein